MNEAEFRKEFDHLLASGWEVTSEGPSGIQLAGTKQMRGLDKACLVFGVCTLIFWGIGLIFILIAVLDYALMTKRPTKFLVRPSPAES